MADIVLLQHGAAEGSCIKECCAQIAAAKKILESHNFSITLQHYDTETNYAGEAESLYRETGFPILRVAISDVFNPGFFNINRQLYSVSQALGAVKDDALVIKLRNDQTIDFNKLFVHLEKFGFLHKTADKILTTNCFTRKDRLYHPSDMFLCSSGALLKAYYSLPQQAETHMDTLLGLMAAHGAGMPQEMNMLRVPESRLFVHFLETQGWNCKFTQGDSLDALRRYCHLVNSWDIDFCWAKKRTPFIKAGGLVLPQTRMAYLPFRGAKAEKNLYYSAHDFYGTRPRAKDIVYEWLSYAVFALDNDFLMQRIRAIVCGIHEQGFLGFRKNIVHYFKCLPAFVREQKQLIAHRCRNWFRHVFLWDGAKNFLSSCGAVILLILLSPWLVAANYRKEYKAKRRLGRRMRHSP